MRVRSGLKRCGEEDFDEDIRGDFKKCRHKKQHLWSQLQNLVALEHTCLVGNAIVERHSGGSHRVHDTRKGEEGHAEGEPQDCSLYATLALASALASGL